MAKKRIPHRSTKRIETLVLVCFFLSGLTGLIYEILWTRMIVKIIGSAPFAVSIILTIFMGGLGLGSYLAGRTVDRIKEPIRLVRVYGILELVIGAYGLIIPVLLMAFKPLFSILYNQLFSHFMLYNLLTFVGCAILLCIPVICMGATLPILCRFYVTKLSHLGTHAGRLYGLNTIGAALGALVCGFWLVELLGVGGSLIVAVLVNGVIGLSCLLIRCKATIDRIAANGAACDSQESPQTVGAQRTIPTEYRGAANGALVIFAVSGFCAMAYEVIWTKLLGLIIGPTTYSFTIVLVTFILGLALGSMIFGWLADKSSKTVWLLIFTQVAAAFFVLATSQLLGNSQLFFAKMIFNFKDQFVLLSLAK
ncbi:MAG: fused MFS/spermidine synthase, partial [Planctomycetota bacterium]